MQRARGIPIAWNSDAGARGPVCLLVKLILNQAWGHDQAVRSCRAPQPAGWPVPPFLSRASLLTLLGKKCPNVSGDPVRRGRWSLSHTYRPSFPISPKRSSVAYASRQCTDLPAILALLSKISPAKKRSRFCARKNSFALQRWVGLCTPWQSVGIRLILQRDSDFPRSPDSDVWKVRFDSR